MRCKLSLNLIAKPVRFREDDGKKEKREGKFTLTLLLTLKFTIDFAIFRFARVDPAAYKTRRESESSVVIVSRCRR